MATVDGRGRLEEDPFSYHVTREGKLFIQWYGKQVMILKGEKARRLLGQLDGADRQQQQLALAKVTGNFKRGNER